MTVGSLSIFHYQYKRKELLTSTNTSTTSSTSSKGPSQKQDCESPKVIEPPTDSTKLTTSQGRDRSFCAESLERRNCTTTYRETRTSQIFSQLDTLATSKMCFEQLTKLKCGHYENYYSDRCKTKLGRTCPGYKNEQVREDKGRSCSGCKAEATAVLEVPTKGALKTKQER